MNKDYQAKMIKCSYCCSLHVLVPGSTLPWRRYPWPWGRARGTGDDQSSWSPWERTSLHSGLNEITKGDLRGALKLDE